MLTWENYNCIFLKMMVSLLLSTDLKAVKSSVHFHKSQLEKISFCSSNLRRFADSATDYVNLLTKNPTSLYNSHENDCLFYSKLQVIWIIPTKKFPQLINRAARYFKQIAGRNPAIFYSFWYSLSKFALFQPLEQGRESGFFRIVHIKQ